VTKAVRGAHRIHREFNLVVRLRTLAARRHWCWAALALAMIAGRILLLPLLPVPQPSVPDEFSYLLAGDTFAHGRLANPTPADAEFFESAHVLVRPAYLSKYPPGQGFVLALGQKLLGHPYWGVVLSAAAMIFLFCWAADAWLPPQWTLVAGGLAWVLFFVRHYWFTSYWGGSLAACGGALVIGGLGHLLRDRLMPARFSLAAGAAILLFTRPYEGGVFCVGVLIVLAVHFFLKLDSAKRMLVLRQVALPNLAVLLAAVSLAGWYNFRTTGSPTDMPYFAHTRQYDESPALWILPPYGVKTYSNANLRSTHDWELATYNREHQLPLRTELAVQFVLLLTGSVWLQFLAFGLLLLGLPWARMRGKRWLVFLLCMGILALMPEVFTLPHYTAPFTAALLIAIVASMRALWYRMAASRARGLIFVSSMAVLATFVFLDYLAVLQTPRTTARATLVRQLTAKGGRHLVLVDYSDGWEPRTTGDWSNGEWVYNGADLQSGTILFAHLRSDEENRQLLKAYPGRTPWLLRLGPKLTTAQLEPYAPAPPEAARSGQAYVSPRVSP
jgi:hypothetical protein